jgi:hypothetical protein
MPNSFNPSKPLKTINKEEELTIRTTIAKTLILLTTVLELFENKYLKAIRSENLTLIFFVLKEVGLDQ